MTQKQVLAWFRLWSLHLIEQKEFISDLDNAIGDGDHGYNMAKGAAAYLKAREQKEPGSIAEEFKLLAMTLLGKVGGASGPLYGSAFLAMAQSAKDVSVIDPSLMVALLENGLDAIKRRGKAERHEKTLIDLWYPIIEDLKNNQLTKESIEAHVNATIPIKATKGRASYLGERSIGHIDPGSYSSGLLFQAMLVVEATI